MKHISLLLYTTFALFLFISPGNVNSQCTTGCTTTINIPSGQTNSSTVTISGPNRVICFTGEGTFSGNIQFNNHNNTTICVGPGVTYANTGYMQNAGGGGAGTQVINHGTWNKNFTDVLMNNLDFTNYGIVNTNGFNMNNGNVIHNYGYMKITGSVTANSMGSFVSHPGTVIDITGNLDIPSGGGLQVGGIINVAGNLNNMATAKIEGMGGCSGLTVGGTFNNTSGGQITGVAVNKAPNPNQNPSGTTTIVINPTPPTNITHPSNALACSGNGNATFSVSATSTQPITYQWQVNKGSGYFNITDGAEYSGTTTNTLSVLSPDVSLNGYQYRALIISCPHIRESNGAVLTVYPRPTATVTPTDVTICNGNNNGRIALTNATGGAGTYQYSKDNGTTWEGSSPNYNFNNLIAGSYPIRIRDAANTSCNNTLGTININQPTKLAALVAQINVTGCFGNMNGGINITGATGGSGTYQYSRDGGANWVGTGTSHSFTNLSAGNYNISIRDAGNLSCVVALGTINITQPAQLNATVTPIHVTGCHGNTNGRINISAAVGGSGTFQYSMDGGANWFGTGTSHSFMNLGSGIFNVRIRDAANPTCFRILNNALSINEPTKLSALATPTNASGCFGNANGSINITGTSGGSQTYQYSNDGGVTWVGNGSSNNFTGLSAGTYLIKVRDASNPTCEITLTDEVIITQPQQLAATVNAFPVTGCFGLTNGRIEITGATGGSGTFQYSRNGGAWLGTGTSHTFTGLGAANYNIRIRDAANPTCIVVLNPSVEVTQPTQLSATLGSQQVTTCFGNNNGSINITGVSGGSGTYSYSNNGGTSWAGSGTSHSFTNLTAATYNVRIRDAANPTCFRILNGALTLVQPAKLNATVTRTLVTGCHGNTNGSITISSPTGGAGTYQYSIDGGSTWAASGLFTSLPAGNYNVQIRDAANPSCVVILNNSLPITQPNLLTANISPTNISGCNGSSNGSIFISGGTGGSGNFQYSINGGTTWPGSGANYNFASLNAGTYTVLMRDFANPTCVVTLNGSLTLTQPVAITASSAKTNVSGCFGNNNGRIDISSTAGGSGTFQYSKDGTNWTGSGNTHSFTSLTSGNYLIRIRDAANPTCIITLPSINISQPAVLTASFNANNVTGCFGANNGTINITGAAGGSGTYEYSRNGGTSWFSGGNSYSFTNLPAGVNNVRIRDAANPSCFITLSNSVVISQPANLTATVIPTNITGCTGNNNGVIDITSPSGGSGVFDYSINGGTDWFPTNTFPNLYAGVYNVQIRDRSNLSCVRVLHPTMVLVETAALTATLSSTSVTTCSGDADGTITITGAAGGSGVFNFSKNGGATWEGSGVNHVFNSVDSGYYNIMIRDEAAINCVAILDNNLRVDDFPILDADIASTNVTLCNGLNNGSITLSGASGGAGFYEYSINGGANWTTSTNFPNLIAGTYDIRIRDRDTPTCFIVLDNDFAVTQPAPLSASISATNVTGCFGNSTGQIQVVSANGGSNNYEYTIDGGTSWVGTASFNSLVATTYDVKMRDADNPACLINLNTSLVISQPAELMGTANGTAVTVCNGNNNGSITISGVSGGSGNYAYSIDGGAHWNSNSTFSNLISDTYNVIIRDASNPTCQKVLNAALSITQPTPLFASMVSSNVTDCNGNTNGSINISGATGGSGTYQFTINGGTGWVGTGNAHDFNSLPAGTYDVRVRDAANTGCVFNLNNAVIIDEPVILSASLTTSNVTGCAGNLNGAINIIGADGGSGSYEYSKDNGNTWEGSGTNYSFTNLGAGTYSVFVRDQNEPACRINLNTTLVIIQPATMVATISPTNVSGCFGNSNGSIALSGVTGGGGTYQYTIDNGLNWVGSGNSHIFAGLSAGTYEIRVRDAATPVCEKVLDNDVVIVQPGGLSGMIDPTHVSVCNGNDNGIIKIINSTGGSGIYEYSIDGGANWYAKTEFTNLIGGSYNVIMRDANSTFCPQVINSTFQLLEPTPLTASVAQSHITTCYQANTGSISITGASGGSNDFQYSVVNGTWSNSGTFINLAAGNYSVKIRDLNNLTCVVELDPSLPITQPIELSATIDSVNVTDCYGNSNGSISITAPTGGSGTYRYSINNGSSWEVSGLYTNLTAGTYRIQIQDQNNPTCIKTLKSGLEIIQPGILNGVVSPNAASGCYGNNNASITITSATGGSGNYQFSIDDEVTWESGATGYHFPDLVTGTYTVWIRDANNVTCKQRLWGPTAIIQPTQITATLTQQNISDCHGSDEGEIIVSNTSGGSGFFQYSKDGGHTWEGSGSNYTFTGIKAGPYNMQIRDAVNPSCFITIANPLVIVEPLKLQASINATNVLNCNGASTGTITITAPAGGSNTYQYSKDGGLTWQPGAVFANLSSGYYNMQIQDAAHPTCIVTLDDSVFLSQPEPLNGTVIPVNASECHGLSNGKILITDTTGGSGNYEFSINNTNWYSDTVFANLPAGTYSVQMRDAAFPGCSILLNGNLELTQPVQLTGSFTHEHVTACHDSLEGSITITAAGGSGLYDYSIANPANFVNSGVFTDLPSGNYNIQVRDRNNQACILVLNPAFQITQPAELNATVTPQDVTVCFGRNNGSITITLPLGGSGNYEYSLNGLPYTNATTFSNLIQNTYTVMMRDRDFPNCTREIATGIVITQPDTLTVGVNFDNVEDCHGSNSGSIEFTNANGGSNTFVYSIDNGATWNTNPLFENLEARIYNLKIRDQANPSCEETVGAPLELTEPDTLFATATVEDVTGCTGRANGEINISTPTGGKGTYEYAIDGTTFTGTRIYTGLTAGIYNVAIRDAANPTCIFTVDSNLEIEEPDTLKGTFTATQVTSCFGEDEGAITITAEGGSGHYEYSILNPESYGNNATFTGLTAGTYLIQIRDADDISCDTILAAAFEIVQPVQLSANALPTDVTTCFGLNNGSIEITEQDGGSGSYQYSLNDSDFIDAHLFTNLYKGTYKIEMRDRNFPDCIVEIASGLDINQPDSLEVTILSTMVEDCHGSSTGSIEFDGASGGSGTFQYSIDNGTTWETNPLFENLEARIYNLKIRDLVHFSCEEIVGAPLEITEPDTLNTTATAKAVTGCTGLANGEINIATPTGGKGTYEYSINGSPFTETQVYTGLTAGLYNVVIRDAINQNCIFTVDPQLEITEPDTLKGTFTATNVTTCFGNNEGTITINAEGRDGNGNYQYSIATPANFVNSNVFTNLAAGTYSIQIRDAAFPSCDTVLNAAFEITEPGLLSATATPTDVTVCHGLNNGSIEITDFNGGSGSYEYTLLNQNAWQSNTVFTNLTAGTYRIEMRDRNHTDCKIILNGNTTIQQPLELKASANMVNVTACYGNTNGQITISPLSGGSGAFDYSISTPEVWAANPTFTSLGAGNYSVKMRDRNNPTCFITINNALQISQPVEIAGSFNVADVSGCIGNNNGVIAFRQVSGGSNTFEYSVRAGEWSSSPDFTNLTAGTYQVIIRDRANPGCIKTIDNNVLINHPNAQTPPVITQQPLPQGPICEKTGTPEFTVSATGTGLTYQWRENGLSINNGTYFTGTTSNSLTITAPPSSFNGKGYDVIITGTCGSVTSSSALLTVINGSVGGELSGTGDVCINNPGNIMYLTGQSGNILHWEKREGTSATWTSINNSADSYDPGNLTETTTFRVIVKNGGCGPDNSTEVIQSVKEIPSQAYAGADQVLCGYSTLLNAVVPVVGQGSWTILNGPNGTFTNATMANSEFSGMEANDYDLIWEVTNGPCAANRDTVNILFNPAVHLIVSNDQEIAIGQNAQLEASGATYINWKADPTLNDITIMNPVATPKTTTTYYVSAMNDGGCKDSASVTIIVKGVIIPNTFTPNDDDRHDRWKIQNISNYPEAQVNIFNRWGQAVGDMKGVNALEAGWDGKHNGTQLPVGTYFYILKLDDQTTQNGSITILR